MRTVCYTVSEREVAVVLQFGHPVVAQTEPGLYFKLPFVQEVTRLPKTYQFWIGNESEILVDLPTADGKKIDVTPWAAWRITDPIRFLEVLRTVENAQSRVQAFVRGAVRNAVTSYNLTDIVRSTNRKLTYSFQVEAPEFGHANAPGEAVKPAPGPGPSEIAGRGYAGTQEARGADHEEGPRRVVGGGRSGEERPGHRTGRRGHFADRVRGPGPRGGLFPAHRLHAIDRLPLHQRRGCRKQEILNRTDAEVQKLLGEGSQEASAIKGKVDAEIIDLYAKAITRHRRILQFHPHLGSLRSLVGGRNPADPQHRQSLPEPAADQHGRAGRTEAALRPPEPKHGEGRRAVPLGYGATGRLGSRSLSRWHALNGVS